MKTDDWQQLWESRRLQELAARVRSARGETSDELTLNRARLASVGAVTLTEGMPAIEELRSAGHAEAEGYLIDLLRGVAEAGADDWARAQLARTRGTAQDESRFSLLGEQLESKNFGGQSRELWQLYTQIGSSPASELASRLATLLAEQPSWLGPEHQRMLAELHQHAGDYAKAAETWLAALETWPEGDGHGDDRLQLALCQWLSGDATLAHKTLIALRDNESAGHGSRNVARRMVADLEMRAPEAPAKWSRSDKKIELAARGTDSGEAARAAALAANSLELAAPRLASIDSFAALRFELEAAQLVVWRIALDEERLTAAIESGALVVLGEERPLGAGFEVIRGLEHGWKILELVDGGRPGSKLRWLDHQWERSAFHGRSALLVLGTSDSAGAVEKKLSAAGLSHEARFDLVDACDLDEDGEKPHRARVDGLTEQATERAPEVAKSWQRRGAALLELLRSGDLEDDQNGEFQRWLEHARERFEDAEWAHQLLAEALEHQDRFDEAGIAWSDAARLDDEDYRNYLGMARVRAATGLTGAAEHSIGRALVLAPSSSSAWSLSARLALSREDLGTAELASELATSLAPEDPNTHMVRSLVHEEADQFDRASESLQRAVDLKPDASPALTRLCRRHLHAGRWDEAQTDSKRLLEQNPGFSSSWALASQVAFAHGQTKQAFAIARQGVEIVGPYSDIVTALGRALSAIATPDTDASSLVPMVIASSDAPLDLADALTREGAFSTAQTVFETLIKMQPEAVNPKWRRAQSLLQQRVWTQELPPGTLELLLDVAERADGFPFPRALFAWLTANDDAKRALEVLSEANAEQAPPLVWASLRHVYGLLGNDEAVGELSNRLQSMGPNATLEAARNIADFGLVDEAKKILGDCPWLEIDFDYAMSMAVICRDGRDFAGATEWAEKALELDPSRDAGRLGWAAFCAGKFDAAKRWNEETAKRLSRESGSSFEDAWLYRAMAALSSTDPAEDAEPEELERAKSHPDVARARHIFAKVTHRDAEPAAAVLAELAPGWLHTASIGGDDA